MNLLLGLFQLLMRGRVSRFRENLSDPRRAQEERLADILQSNSTSVFGREHRFDKITDPDAFRREVPIRRYEDFSHWLERMRQGEGNVLVSQPVSTFSTTSGTTAEPKYCPVTRRFTLEHHRSHLIWLYHFVCDHPTVATGRYLTVLSPAEVGRTTGGIPFGSASGRAYLNQAWPIRRRHAVPYEAFALDDYDARYHAILVFALGGDLSNVTSVNPSTLVLLASRMRDRAEALLDDVAAGRLSHAGTKDLPGLQDLEGLLRPQPERARQLHERRQVDGCLLPRNAWPDLGAIVTWQGGSAPFYLAQLDQLWGAKPRRCLGLRASEGTLSIPLQDQTPSGVLATGGHFLEFVEEGTVVEPGTQTLLAHELEVGRRYRTLITTSGGFYRYDLADIVEVTGFSENTPEIAFLHKAGNVLSITGEKVTEDQVVTVMQRISKDFPPLGGFTVTLELIDAPRLVLAVEIAPGGPEETRPDLRGLLQRFDNDLKAANEEYAGKRASERLGPPRLLQLASGSYALHRMAMVGAGQPDGQIKPPHLVQPHGPGAAPVAGCPFFDRVTVVDSICA